MNKDDKYNEMEGLNTNFDALFQEASGDDDKVRIPAEYSDFTVKTVVTNLRRCVTSAHKCDECEFKGADDCKMVLLKQAFMAMMFLMAELQAITDTIALDGTDDDTEED